MPTERMQYPNPTQPQRPRPRHPTCYVRCMLSPSMPTPTSTFRGLNNTHRTNMSIHDKFSLYVEYGLGDELTAGSREESRRGTRIFSRHKDTPVRIHRLTAHCSRFLAHTCAKARRFSWVGEPAARNVKRPEERSTNRRTGAVAMFKH